jgi:hypothetical protein
VLEFSLWAACDNSLTCAVTQAKACELGNKLKAELQRADKYTSPFVGAGAAQFGRKLGFLGHFCMARHSQTNRLTRPRQHEPRSAFHFAG